MIGPYQVLGPLGRDRGRVFKALDAAHDQTVAVKLLPPKSGQSADAVQRFEREAQALGALRHPNIARILGTGQHESRLYFVMEFVPGSGLDAVLRRRRLSVGESLNVFVAICLGMEEAHRHNLFHRSLWPDHVVVADDLSTVKLTDFGLAGSEQAAQDATLAPGQLNVGAMHCMAPEEREWGAVDARSNIYSAGVILYEMLTGRPPVGRFGLPSQINHDVSPELDPIVLACLKTNPADRYPDVAAVLKDVARLEDRLGLGVTHELQAFSRSTTNLLGSARTAAGSRVAQGIAAAVLLLVVAGGYVAFRRHGTVSPRAAAGIPPATAARPAGPPAQAPSAGVDPAAQDLQRARDQVTAEAYAPALATLRSIITEHPTSPSVVDAYLLTAQVQVATGHPADAMSTYAEIRSRFPRDHRAAEAGFHLGELLDATGDSAREDEARQIFHDVANTFSEVPWAPRSLAAAATIEEARNLVAEDAALGGASVPAAIATLRQLTTTYPNVPEAEKALWDLGSLYDKVGQYELAARAFVDLGTHFPETKYDAWWRAGQLYEQRLSEDAQAVGAYRRVPPASPHAADAQKRIAQLSR